MTMVTDSAVRLAVLSIRTCSSLNHGLLDVTAGVTVTPPVPPPLSLTVRLTVVVWVRPPPVPVTVTVAAPSVAVLDADKLIVLLPPVVDDGLKLAVTPVGNPPALNATLPVNPPVRVMVIALVPLAPRLTVKLAGLAESEKSGFTTP